MKISAGMLITDGIHLLVCHVTGGNNFDIPKGQIEFGEQPIEACIRETFEETNLVYKKYQLKDLGEVSYLIDKNLHLFLTTVPQMPHIEILKCTSMFERYGKSYPEVDYYKIIKISDMEQYLTKNMIISINLAINLYDWERI